MNFHIDYRIVFQVDYTFHISFYQEWQEALPAASSLVGSNSGQPARLVLLAQAWHSCNKACLHALHTSRVHHGKYLASQSLIMPQTTIMQHVASLTPSKLLCNLFSVATDSAEAGESWNWFRYPSAEYFTVIQLTFHVERCATITYTGLFFCCRKVFGHLIKYILIRFHFILCNILVHCHLYKNQATSMQQPLGHVPRETTGFTLYYSSEVYTYRETYFSR